MRTLCGVTPAEANHAAALVQNSAAVAAFSSERISE